jgi:hypothetical protein
MVGKLFGRMDLLAPNVFYVYMIVIFIIIPFFNMEVHWKGVAS